MSVELMMTYKYMAGKLTVDLMFIDFFSPECVHYNSANKCSSRNKGIVVLCCGP